MFKKQLANLITGSRVLLAFVVWFLLLYFFQAEEKQKELVYLSFILSILVIIGDFLDGQVSRLLKQTSLFGAWFDIAADRLVELGFWVVFAKLNLVSIWIALIFLARGILVDGVRNLAQKQSLTAFGQKSMMQSNLGTLLVSSSFSRTTYAILKVFAFSLVILSINLPELAFWANACVYASTVFCILRGIPVLQEGKRFFAN